MMHIRCHPQGHITFEMADMPKEHEDIIRNRAICHIQLTVEIIQDPLKEVMIEDGIHPALADTYAKSIKVVNDELYLGGY